MAVLGLLTTARRRVDVFESAKSLVVDSQSRHSRTKQRTPHAGDTYIRAVRHEGCMGRFTMMSAASTVQPAWVERRHARGIKSWRTDWFERPLLHAERACDAQGLSGRSTFGFDGGWQSCHADAQSVIPGLRLERLCSHMAQLGQAQYKSGHRHNSLAGTAKTPHKRWEGAEADMPGNLALCHTWAVPGRPVLAHCTAQTGARRE